MEKCLYFYELNKWQFFDGKLYRISEEIQAGDV